MELQSIAKEEVENISVENCQALVKKCAQLTGTDEASTDQDAINLKRLIPAVLRTLRHKTQDITFIKELTSVFKFVNSQVVLTC
ncbi:hypothetical protein J437_LFUL019345 [Ladona fulva]|uniref:Uncharacterized protein n=1 Tax=Ladona fulva TaxID=123851 RepID=A0A8K0P7G4_LADFU|nr:hypothetical protein J437_LFUL019345 [Ladona fulva]